MQPMAHSRGRAVGAFGALLCNSSAARMTASVGLLEQALREAAHAGGLAAVRKRVQALQHARARVQLRVGLLGTRQPLAQRRRQAPLPRRLLLRLRPAWMRITAAVDISAWRRRCRAASSSACAPGVQGHSCPRLKFRFRPLPRRLLLCLRARRVRSQLH